MLRKVAALEHEAGDDAVEGLALVFKGVLARAEFAEVPCGLGHDLVMQLEGDTARLRVPDVDVELAGRGEWAAANNRQRDAHSRLPSRLRTPSSTSSLLRYKRDREKTRRRRMLWLCPAVSSPARFLFHSSALALFARRQPAPRHFKRHGGIPVFIRRLGVGKDTNRFEGRVAGPGAGTSTLVSDEKCICIPCSGIGLVRILILEGTTWSNNLKSMTEIKGKHCERLEVVCQWKC